MQAFRVLTALALAWIGLLCVVLGAPAKADPINADPIRTVAPGANTVYPATGRANTPASRLRAMGSSGVGQRDADRIGDTRAGIPSGVAGATPPGTGLVRTDSGAVRPTGASGAPIDQRFRAAGANAARIGYSGSAGRQYSHPLAWHLIDPHHRLTTALRG
jgi:hypothetical protein